MRADYLRPVIDSGSSRVFDCNATTMKLQREGVEDELFFRHPRLNRVIIVKHSVLPEERRRRAPAVGTKLFFPFNENSPFEGGSTIYLHDPNLTLALNEKCGVNRGADPEGFDEDLRLLTLLGRLPTLDAFLLRDILESEQIAVNERYLEISEDQWGEIEGFIQKRFVPIVKAAFPEANASRSKARKLIEKLWEAKDQDGLGPLIAALQLPPDRALEILYSWKVITFYSFQYRRLKPTLVELAQWLKESEAAAHFSLSPVRRKASELHGSVRQELRTQWRRIEDILNGYEDAYDKMFVARSDSGPFLEFLHNCRQTFWEIGDALGKCDHAVYCWDKLTERYPRRRLQPVDALENALEILAGILGADLENEGIAIR